MELKQSGLGIASFLICLMAGCAMFALFVAAGVMETSTPGGMDEEAPAIVVLGVLIIGTILLQFVALCLGLAGLVQPNRAKVFAVLGVFLSATAIFGTVALIAIGSTL